MMYSGGIKKRWWPLAMFIYPIVKWPLQYFVFFGFCMFLGSTSTVEIGFFFIGFGHLMIGGHIMENWQVFGRLFKYGHDPIPKQIDDMYDEDIWFSNS